MGPSLNFPDPNTRVWLFGTLCHCELEHPKGGLLTRLTEGCSPLEVKEGMGPLWLNL